MTATREQADRHLRGGEPQLIKEPTLAVRPPKKERGIPVESPLEAAGTHGGRDKGPFGRLALDPKNSPMSGSSAHT